MNKLKKLRKIFKIYKLDGYIIPKNDEFFGEYVDERYDRLKYISSFSGSAGYAIILRSNSYLFVDGRYTLQAKIINNKFFILNDKAVGKNYKGKINLVCKILKKRKINKLLITAPENLAWLLNIRGKDSKYSPLPNCHAILDNKKKITLIVNKKKINI